MNIEFTVKIVAKVPDDFNDADAFLEIPLEKVFVKNWNGEVPAKITSYETEHWEALD